MTSAISTSYIIETKDHNWLAVYDDDIINVCPSALQAEAALVFYIAALIELGYFMPDHTRRVNADGIDVTDHRDRWDATDIYVDTEH